MYGLEDPNDVVDLGKLTASIKQGEGLRLKPYTDTVGKTTIGWGRDLTDNGISQFEAGVLLANDIQTAIKQSSVEGWWPHVEGNDARARACAELMFILGPTKFAGFEKATAALLVDDFTTAAAEFKDSLLERQDGARIDRLCTMIATGADV